MGTATKQALDGAARGRKQLTEALNGSSLWRTVTDTKEGVHIRAIKAILE